MFTKKRFFLILLTVERKHGRKARPGEVAMPMLGQSGFRDRATPFYLYSIFELSLSKSMCNLGLNIRATHAAFTPIRNVF